ncbi:MAG: ECF transporter S component, partial [Agathobacter sp.]|nr:ECF transporter S component [Agathobacter sp.]
METKSLRKSNVVMMTELALLTAIVILMAYTPLGYLKVGAVSITFIVVPVAVGAVLLGVKAGAFLGLVFGLTSLAQ